MDISKIIQSIIQGVTELFPISSSGHLILTQSLIDGAANEDIITVLHLGSAIALVIYFWSDILEMIKPENIINNIKLVEIGILPTVTIGLLYGAELIELLYSPLIVALSLFFWGGVMICMSYMKADSNTAGDAVDDVVTLKQAAIIGLIQPFALIPGSSRSGITAIAGVHQGLGLSKALDFSFMMGIPLLLGAYLKNFIDDGITETVDLTLSNLWYIILTAAVTYITLIFLYRFKHKEYFRYFGLYRVVLSVVVIILLGANP